MIQCIIVSDLIRKMNSILTLIKREPKKFLGRWTVDYCSEVLNTKIRLANEDNCGTCHFTTTQQMESKGKNYKEVTEATWRYQEYINVAVCGRKLNKTFVNTSHDIDMQIQHYICMH